MADLFIIRERLKFSAIVLAAAALLGGLATWHFWTQLEYELDESRFLLAAVSTGALTLGAVGVFVFYLSAKRVVNPSHSFTERFDNLPWWAVKTALLVLVIAVAGFFILRYGDRAANEFDLLRAGKLQVLEERLEVNPKLVERPNDKGAFLVQEAYRLDKPDAVMLLLKYNSPVADLDPAGRDPVFASIANLPMLRALLESGLSPSVTDADGTPAIHYAAVQGAAEASELLLEFGAEVDARNRLYRTPMMQCIEAGMFPMAGKLIEAGADVDAFDQRGDTALHIAARKRSAEGLQLLLDSQADPTVFNFIHMTALHIAAQGGYEPLIPLFAAHLDSVDLTDEIGRTPFELALANRKYGAAEMLLEHGADINRVKADGGTVLHHAVNSKDYRSARFLIRAGAKADIPDKDGRTVMGICRLKELDGLVELIENPAPEEE